MLIKKIILIKLKKNMSSLDYEKIGAEFFSYIIEANSIFNSTSFQRILVL